MKSNLSEIVARETYECEPMKKNAVFCVHTRVLQKVSALLYFRRKRWGQEE